MDPLNLLINLIIDIVVLFYIAGFFGVTGNRASKAFIVTIISYAVGYFGLSILGSALAFGIGTLFLTLVFILFVRLLMIGLIYKIGLFQSLTIWIVTAIVSVLFTVFIPL